MIHTAQPLPGRAATAEAALDVSRRLVDICEARDTDYINLLAYRSLSTAA